MWPRGDWKAQHLGQHVPFDVSLCHWTVTFDSRKTKKNSNSDSNYLYNRKFCSHLQHGHFGKSYLKIKISESTGQFKHKVV